MKEVTKQRLLTAAKVVGTIGSAVVGADVFAADAATNITWNTSVAEVTEAAKAVKDMVQAGTGVVAITFAWSVFRKA